ncbi:retrovirus-related pol polyprotein from transposon TNT 1-94 [Tanacetum coccineum]|uniref:Retrovirus-related pol polyprotein from transposon TNT 1-94 n=1 Tax=Tanacetum coccineum TaxID=301880 RepID=A0ABQ5AVL3_9ASTR
MLKVVRVNQNLKKDYKAKFKKMKAKLALLEASPPASKSSKPFQSKNKCLIAETFNWDEEEISNDEEETQVKVLMALADDELFVGKNHARNGGYIDITMKKVNILLSMDEDLDWKNYLKYINIDLKYVEEQILNLLSKYNKIVFELNKCRDDLLDLKQAKLEAATFQIQNTKLIKLNHALQDQLKEERKLTESSSKNDANDNLFVPASLDYDHEMIPKSKDWVERLNPESKLPNFNTRRILVPERPATIFDPEPVTSSVPIEVKTYDQESKIYELPKLVQILMDEKINSTQKPREPISLSSQPESSKSSQNYKAQPYQYASPSKQILKSKAKPFPPCTHCGFNDHRLDDCRNYPKCKLFVLLVEVVCTQPLITMILNTLKERHIREPIWYLDNGCSRSITGVKSYLYKYVEQLGPKVAFVNGLIYNLISINQLCDAKYIVQFDATQGTIFNANKEIVLIAPRRNDVYVIDMSSLTINGAYFFAKASESINWLWHKRLSHLNFKTINKLAKKNKFLGLPSLVYSKDKPCSACEKGKHKRASFKTKQNFSIRKCLHLLHMDLFRPVTERKNKTLIEAARTMMNGSVLSKHFWTEAVRIACYTQNRSIIVKIQDRNPYEIYRQRIPDISYFHVFGCPVFIHNDKDHLGKFDAKADGGYFLGYSFNSKAFRLFNIRRKQIEETYHVTFDESIKAIRFDLNGYSDSTMLVLTWIEKAPPVPAKSLGGSWFVGVLRNNSQWLSSTVAEYVAAAGCCANILWIKSQLSNYDIHYKMVPIFWDNTNAIAISNNPVLHSETKHIDIRHFFIKDHILKGDIGLHFILTKYQLADIFTKPIDEPTFTKLKAELGMLNIDWEFWSTVIAYDPFPFIDETEQRLLREILIKFSVLNRQRHLTHDFNTFCSSTGLDYKHGKYVAHPTSKVVKKELGKIAINPSYLDKTPV